MKISGSILNPRGEIIELVLHLPPLSVQLEAISVKFVCKVLTKEDYLVATFYQVDESKSPKFQHLFREFKSLKGIFCGRMVESIGLEIYIQHCSIIRPCNLQPRGNRSLQTTYMDRGHSGETYI